MHDAVEPEVQVGLVELEELLEQCLQLFVLLTHLVSVPRGFVDRARRYSTAHRIVKSVSVAVRCAKRASSTSISWSRFSMISSSTLKISCR